MFDVNHQSREERRAPPPCTRDPAGCPPAPSAASRGFGETGGSHRAGCRSARPARPHLWDPGRAAPRQVCAQAHSLCGPRGPGRLRAKGPEPGTPPLPRGPGGREGEGPASDARGSTARREEGPAARAAAPRATCSTPVGPKRAPTRSMLASVLVSYPCYRRIFLKPHFPRTRDRRTLSPWHPRTRDTRTRSPPVPF